MNIRKATPSDITQLQLLCRQAYTESFGDHWINTGLEVYLNDQFGTDRMCRDLSDPALRYYFILEDDRPVGFMKLQLKARVDGRESCELEKMYLLNGWKGRGVGSAALRRLLDRLTGEGIRRLYLCVLDSNHGAVAFYKRLGFAHHSRLRLEVPDFREELRGMHRMVYYLNKLENETH